MARIIEIAIMCTTVIAVVAMLVNAVTKGAGRDDDDR